MAKGMSQGELANELDFSQSHIANIELGNVNCSVSHAAALAKALNIRIVTLFDF
jgi:ribosome-binding protein aMBF1 (putative translation factor)